MSTLLLLPGDGIGPEVCAQVRRVAAAITPDLQVSEAPYGGSSYDAHGTPLLDEVRDQAIASDAVLMGAVGGPQWADAPRHLRPEARRHVSDRATSTTAGFLRVSNRHFNLTPPTTPPRGWRRL